MQRVEILTDPRFAGMVKCYHTWPTLKAQSVADHSFHVMRIYWQLFGPLPSEVSTYILWHDAGELVAGDIPFPSKACNPRLKQEHDRLEAQAVTLMEGALPELPPLLMARIKLADLLEMYEYGKIELGFGNNYAQPIIADIKVAVARLLAAGIYFPSEDVRKVWQFMKE